MLLTVLARTYSSLLDISANFNFTIDIYIERIADVDKLITKE
jgi:hypothetical protein